MIPKQKHNKKTLENENKQSRTQFTFNNVHKIAENYHRRLYLKPIVDITCHRMADTCAFGK